MIERYLIQSPLAHLGLDSRRQEVAEPAGVHLSERALPAVASLRGPRADPSFKSAFKGFAGFDLPDRGGVTSGDQNRRAFWLGPDEWWLVDTRGSPGAGADLAKGLRAALSALPAAVTDISDSRAAIRLSGAKARATLQKACPLDLHPREFGAGQCARTRLAKATALIHLAEDESAPGGPAFDIYIVRSFAEYTWHWLESAGREYGVAVGPA